MDDARTPGPHQEESHPGELSAGEAALGGLVDGSVAIRPDELPDVVARSAKLIGLADVVIYLIDKYQRQLIPVPGGSELLSLDSMAGRSFRRSEAMVGEPSPDGATNVWFPLLDGGDRIGVLGARLEADGPFTVDRGRHLATLTARLLASTSRYGDNLLTAHRLRDMSLAAEMRWALLPPLTFVSPDVSIAGYLVPAYDIAGDAFDYALAGHVAHLAIFDARGHGLTASRIANLALASYRHARRIGATLVEAYGAMDETIAAELGPDAEREGETFATAQLATLDLSDGGLAWINAGHPLPLRLRGGRVQELAGDPALPAGFGSVGATVNEERLEPGDLIVFYSDGVTEARSPDGEEFGVDRLGDFLVRAASAQETPPETARRLMHAIVEHTAGEEGDLADDATVLIVRWRP